MALRTVVVDSFAALASHPWRDGRNALCWPRTLDGDFGAIARLLAPHEGVATVAPETLAELPLDTAGRVAAAVLLDDLHRLEALGREPVLNCIASYPRDERGLAIATDVMSFHADRAPVAVDTWLCTYWGRSTEGLDNDEARRLIEDPAIRTALLQHHGGADDEAFATFVREGSFDLHHAALPDARPYSFGRGHLWRIAVDWPGCPVPPCLHRAPETLVGDDPRLLLIC